MGLLLHTFPQSLGSYTAQGGEEHLRLVTSLLGTILVLHDGLCTGKKYKSILCRDTIHFSQVMAQREDKNIKINTQNQISSFIPATFPGYLGKLTLIIFIAYAHLHMEVRQQLHGISISMGFVIKLRSSGLYSNCLCSLKHLASAYVAKTNPSARRSQLTDKNIKVLTTDWESSYH